MSNQFVQYDHHGTRVWVRDALKGQHRSHCLCYSCTKFKPGQPDNCPLAQGLYDLCVKNDMVTPVWECPQFVEDVSHEHQMCGECPLYQFDKGLCGLTGDPEKATSAICEDSPLLREDEHRKEQNERDEVG